LICPECGSYQPDRAKFCGLCGSPLSQDGLVESFLKDNPEHEIVLPHHRSPWFYLIIGLTVLLALAVLAGAGYLVYRVAWGEEKGGQGDGGAIEDNNLDYTNNDFGFSFSYPDNWTLEEGYTVENELVSLKVSLSTQKNLELHAYQLDPVVSIGGLEGIKEYLVEDATDRIHSLGGTPPGAGTSATTGGQAGYTQPEPSRGNTAGGEETSAEDIFTSTHLKGLPVFYTEFNANYMGEETRFLIYYIVAGDYLFVFQGQAPAGEYKSVRPQLFAITGSFKWEERAEDTPEQAMPGKSAR